MNELEELVKRDDGKIAVDARQLHDFLEVGRDFSHWFKEMAEYGFESGKDFTPFSAKSRGGRPRTEYAMSLDMAKEVAMIQRTDKGKQARRYFIAMEKQAKQFGGYAVPTNYATALRLAADQQEHILKLQPKADYFDQQMHNPGLITTTVIAKRYGRSARWLNSWLADHGVIFKQGSNWIVRQHFADEGYADYESWSDSENKHVHNLLKWTQKGQKFIYDVLKQEGILPVTELMALPN